MASEFTNLYNETEKAYRDNEVVGTTYMRVKADYDVDTQRICGVYINENVSFQKGHGVTWKVKDIESGEDARIQSFNYYNIVDGEEVYLYNHTSAGFNENFESVGSEYNKYVDYKMPLLSNGARSTITSTSFPIFKNEEDAEHYALTGDDSKAVNYDDLHGVKADYYLTNNGDRISIKIAAQEEDKPVLLDSTTLTFTSDLIPLYSKKTDFNGYEFSDTWDNIIANLMGISQVVLNPNLINDLVVKIDGYYHTELVTSLSCELKKGNFMFKTESIGLTTENNGYHLYLTTDNSFDDITTPDNSNSDATDNPEDGANFGGFTNLTCTYKMGKQALSDLGTFMWTNDAFDNIKLLNNSPMENIVNLMYMPVDIGGTNSNVVLGNIETNISGSKVSQTVKKVNIASFTMPKLNTGFLGYEPYTSCSIYLPLVGMIDLQPKDVCGYTVTIDYAFDVVVGSFGVFVYTSKGGGKTLIYSSQGTCSVSIPLTSSNRAQMEASLLTSGVGLVGDFASENYLGAASSILDMALTPNHSNTFGSPSSQIGATAPSYVYYILRTPIVNLPSNFAHTKGYMCMQTYKLSDLKGYTVCTPDLDISGISCTEEERDMLMSELTSGIYL